MKSDHDNVRLVVEEDRISRLPDELIHKILSCFDIKVAVQTCVLSSRWKLLWTSMPFLNFSNVKVPDLCSFAKFVTHVLCGLNHQIHVSSVKLDFKGAANEDFGIALCGDLFSKCVNLKNLTLKRFTIKGVDVFDIIAPRLSNLRLINSSCSKVINIIAPQLENLTVDNCRIKCLNGPSGLPCLCYRGYRPTPLSKDGLRSLNKVDICLSMYFSPILYKEGDARKIIDMLQNLHSAKYLTLNADIVECISSFPDLLLEHPSPFNNLISLTVDSSMREFPHKVKMSTEARNFLLNNSPSATLRMIYSYIHNTSHA
ncbi:unnamed protein product [Lactuca virosa]|uniref:F-box domain-containing protein n=1 Tax=Lactuca virosa TaxID=75947 RepID=A0AAU9LPS3_9ASTR|nr:unnamed protein product [Lactuca virosa]